MSWVIDTCLVIDVLEDDTEFGVASARLIDSKAEAGLVIAPVTYIELAPAFLGDRRREDEFLGLLGVALPVVWSQQDTVMAHEAWDRYVNEKRKGQMEKRPLADIMIGAFACRHAGLMTRNPNDFTDVFPGLAVATP